MTHEHHSHGGYVGDRSLLDFFLNVNKRKNLKKKNCRFLLSAISKYIMH